MGDVGKLWRDLPVGRKIVAPYLVLTLLVGVLVSAVATQQLAGQGAQQLSLIALHEQDNINTVFNAVEERELSELRLLSGSDGVGAAISARDLGALRARLLPLIADQQPNQVEVAVAGADGRQLLSLRADPQQPGSCLCQVGIGPLAYDHAADVLAGRADQYGSRFVGLHGSGAGRQLYTIGPVLDAAGRIVGAIAVGETLDQVLAELARTSHVEVAVFDPQGDSLGSSVGLDVAVPSLAPADRAAAVAGRSAVVRPVSVGSSHEAIVYVPWILRFQPYGYVAMLVPDDPLAAAQAMVLPVIVGVCLAALLLTVVAGSLVTRAITTPLGEVLKATSEVGGGHLEHRARVRSQDEIGRLTASFNAMTELLQERTARLERFSDDALLSLSATIDARDRYTHRHSIRVAAYSHALARAAGISRSELDVVRRGCLVHDIGKIGVADRVLAKPGPLDPEELAEMRRHPVIGRRLLRGMAWERGVFDIVLHHHERWDGNGYPLNLQGEAIPRLARIVAVADALDALTSTRPYRPAHSFNRAAREILGEAGRQFDPAIVAIFAEHRAEFFEVFRSLQPAPEKPVLTMAS
ncbi:MAG TPA: HD domain-containing phosphohydrolase [Candidatus Dormibacteraeota bacterium]